VAVTYEYNYMDAEPVRHTYLEKVPLAVPDAREGYVFSGWFDGSSVTSATATAYPMPARDVKMTKIWTEVVALPGNLDGIRSGDNYVIRTDGSSAMISVDDSARPEHAMADGEWAFFVLDGTIVSLDKTTMAALAGRTVSVTVLPVTALSESGANVTDGHPVLKIVLCTDGKAVGPADGVRSRCCTPCRAGSGRTISRRTKWTDTAAKTSWQSTNDANVMLLTYETEDLADVVPLVDDRREQASAENMTAAVDTTSLLAVLAVAGIFLIGGNGL
jgi:uncharacterized repeat protein (TIGR02543 family)